MPASEKRRCCCPDRRRRGESDRPRGSDKPEPGVDLPPPQDGGSAVQLGTHLFISGEIRILIGVEHLISQQDLKTVDGAPGSQGAGVSRGEIVIVQHQVRSAVQREGAGQIHIHSLSILKVIPAVQLLHTVRCGRALKPRGPRGEKHSGQHDEDQSFFNRGKKPALVSHGIGPFS